MAAYLAKLPPPEPAGGSTDATRIERARTLIEQHRCNFCHSRDYSGQQNVPRLAGQREDYLVKALREYKNNTRRGYDASMADVLYWATSLANLLPSAQTFRRFRRCTQTGLIRQVLSSAEAIVENKAFDSELCHHKNNKLSMAWMLLLK